VQTDPRYRFGDNHGQPYSARNGALLTLDTGIPAHELAAEANGAVQEPPPKKGVKRKKAKQPNGVEPRPEPETNGDAMEVEQNGVAHVTNSVRAESDAPVSEAESSTVAEIPISTLSIGQDAEIQTELIADLARETILVPRSKEPGRLVQHTSWAPLTCPFFSQPANPCCKSTL
jgi:transducin (beta)-like 1